ncbi:MAG: HNH endonuclease [Thermoguttaceae bacterium]|jgi:hypothetical protein|nr:HNH endonuclease [Thermoguttaceae bacterium]
MATYILLWDPRYEDWADFDACVQATQEGKSITIPCECKGGEEIAPGDTVFLLRKKVKPLGGLAKGRAVSGSYPGERTPMVDAEFTQILKLHDGINAARFLWAAGINFHALRDKAIQVPRDLAAKLDDKWKEHIRTLGPSRPKPKPLPDSGYVSKLSLEEKKDYSAYNKRIEAEQRIGQSQFRAKVLENFEWRCCLSDIDQRDLLVASHIKPWSASVTTRLDPANGLCFFVLHDKLFDQGYIAFDDSLRVIVTPHIGRLSEPLQKILREIEGRPLRSPVNTKIKQDYIDYHRQHTFWAESAD